MQIIPLLGAFMTHHELDSTRRHFVQTLGTAAGVAAFPVLAQTSEVKVGFLLPLTGSFAESGQLIKMAVEMARRFWQLNERR
jgi:ABC-type branched-subunit amino acid transport system substrate-binding protein